MYVHNNNICLKFKDTCFAKFSDSLEITLQFNKICFAFCKAGDLHFAKWEARILTL